MRDESWELFKKTGLPQAYCYYKARQRRLNGKKDEGDAG